MRPKGKLFALFAVFAAIGLVTATGAFTTVEAQRTVTVDTAGDANALLGLDGNSSSDSNGDYATTENNQLVIDFSEDNLQNIENADGVNLNATTEVDHVVNVTNNGAQDIYFYVETTNSNSDVTLELYQGGDASSGNLTGTGNAVQINSGNTQSVGISIVTDDNVDTFNETVTFHAESEDPSPE